jgi:hypothetical protein
MRAMFANLTRDDFGGRSNRETGVAERLRVHALFDEIQVAIYNGDFARVDRLTARLTLATGSRSRPLSLDQPSDTQSNRSSSAAP